MLPTRGVGPIIALEVVRGAATDAETDGTAIGRDELVAGLKPVVVVFGRGDFFRRLRGGRAPLLATALKAALVPLPPNVVDAAGAVTGLGLGGFEGTGGGAASFEPARSDWSEPPTSGGGGSVRATRSILDSIRRRFDFFHCIYGQAERTKAAHPLFAVCARLRTATHERLAQAVHTNQYTCT